jgi:hypothetical protein
MPHLFLFHTTNIPRLIQIAVLAGVAVPPNLHAQEYPGKAITVIVPFPAGGPSDVVARIVTEQMSKRLGQSMVIENVGAMLDAEADQLCGAGQCVEFPDQRR